MITSGRRHQAAQLLATARAALNDLEQLLAESEDHVATSFGPDQRGVMSIAEAARRIGIATTTAYDLIKRNDFPVRVLQIGGRMKISVAELEQLLGPATEAV